MPTLDLTEETTLPADRYAGALAGAGLAARSRRPFSGCGQARRFGRRQRNISRPCATFARRRRRPRRFARRTDRASARLRIFSPSRRATSACLGSPRLLAPIDLQAIKAAGVTFAQSLLERVIEERARGSREGAAKAREEIVRALGDDLSTLKPGSPAAMRLKDGAGRRQAHGRNIWKSDRTGRGGFHQEPADVSRRRGR